MGAPESAFRDGGHAKLKLKSTPKLYEVLLFLRRQLCATMRLKNSTVSSKVKSRPSCMYGGVTLIPFVLRFEGTFPLEPDLRSELPRSEHLFLPVPRD
jgi:hypothetical protein